MARDFDAFRSRVKELVDRFEKFKPDYRRETYDETTLRLEYLNPFFEALGWDVSNNLGHPPHLREVRVEYPAQDGTSSRRADYVFRVGGFERFVCEAKKFPERLDNSHYQVQNYAYNLRLWIAVISNFDELHLFVVGGKPNKARPFTPVSGWRLYSWEYENSAKRIWDLLSRDAVENGSLEAFIQLLPKVSSRGGKQLWLIKPDRNKAVDVDFLNYLERERARLAQHLVRDNPSIRGQRPALNEAVQRIIDRLLFQRVCEDREIDTFQPLRKALDSWEASGRRAGDLWHRIVDNLPLVRARLHAADAGHDFGSAFPGIHGVHRAAAK
jgi:hypothetical protein